MTGALGTLPRLRVHPLDQSWRPQPLPQRTGRAELHQVIGLADSLEVAGQPIAGFDAVRERWAAVTTPPAANPLDVLAATPGELQRLVLDTASRNAAAEHLGRAQTGVEHALCRAALGMIAEQGDKLVHGLRKQWAPAWRAVADAYAAGIRPDTTAADVVDLSATAPAVLDLWRALPAAAGTLNELANLRLALAVAGEYGPAEQGWTIANLLGTGDDTRMVDVESAIAVWTGDVEYVQTSPSWHDEGHRFGSAIGATSRPRAGGPWLAYLDARITPVLTTAAEAEQAKAAARRSPAL